MDPPPDTTDLKLKKKKKKKKKSKHAHDDTAVEEERVTEPDTEEGRQGAEERTEGSDGVKKKKKKKKLNGQSTDPEETTRGADERKCGGEKMKRGDGGEMTKKKKKKATTEKEEEKQTPTNSRKRKKGGESAPPARQTPRKRVRTPALLDEDAEPPNSKDMVIEAELAELEEFIPDIRTKAADVIFKIKRYDLPRFREFKRQGLKIRWGRYSHEENLRIRRNVDDFLKLTGIETVDELLFPRRYPDREQSLKNLKSQHCFYQRLSDGLLRTSEQVYNRSKKMFDPRNHLGRFSVEEVKALEKLHTLHGNDWRTIGDKLERSIYACEKRCAELGFQNGPWTPEELQRFQHVMKKQLQRQIRTSQSSSASWIQLCSRLPWSKISHRVQTRSWNQCRGKWFSYLKSRLKGTQKVLPGAAIQTRIRLIQMGLTPMCAQRLFHRIKVSRVPGWNKLSFGEIVDVLFQNEIPELQMKLASNKNHDYNSVPEPEPGPEDLSLDQIFPKNQEEFTELDNS
uniref:Transcription termination factor 1 n=1 Tax=Neogobius melanostomus TaxID=47308 RepID=A0A8C6WSW6_9GOBI